MILRPALPADAEMLAALGRDSFVAAFGHLYSAEDLGLFLDTHKTPAAYSRYIADSGVRIALAESNGRPAGFCILVERSEFVEHSDAETPVALSQLYCAPGRSGEGIGAALMDWALSEAQTLGADAIQLSVWSGNAGAQRFYARYGFEKIADIHFMVGNHRDDEYLLEKRLPGRVAGAVKC
jgi:ribosomal protein S18 acetylase RimI-like enzyme